jgi:hypothetical protein
MYSKGCFGRHFILVKTLVVFMTCLVGLPDSSKAVALLTYLAAARLSDEDGGRW